MDTKVDADHLASRLNFRDLGGLVARNGSVIARGRLYRSGDVSLIPATLSMHRAPHTSIDLRTSVELHSGSATVLKVLSNRIHLPLFETVRSHWMSPADQAPRATATRYLEMLEDGAVAMTRVVAALGDAENYPVVIHCAAGRDRTGIVVACLLDLLGIPDESIAADYALSEGSIDDGGRAHPETMMRFLTSLRTKHGSTEKFLRSSGTTNDELTMFVNALLSRQS